MRAAGNHVTTAQDGDDGLQHAANSTDAPAPAPATPGSRQARGQATRETILHAAADGFARQGYDHCSLEEIAQAAGVSKGLLLYHFRSKDELLDAVERAVVADLLARVKTATAGVGPSLDQALWALDQAWTSLRDEQAFLSIYMQAALRARRDSPDERAAVGEMLADHRAILLDGARTTLGPLSEALPIGIEELADILLATLSGLATARMQGEDPARTDRAYSAFRRLLELVMTAPRAARRTGGH